MKKETLIRAVRIDCRYCKNDVKVYEVVGTEFRYYCGLCKRYFWNV
jgi:hypothetical protein